MPYGSGMMNLNMNNPMMYYNQQFPNFPAQMIDYEQMKMVFQQFTTLF